MSCRSCRGWSLQYTLAEGQTQMQVQTQAHGARMHAERTDTDTPAQRTDACLALRPGLKPKLHQTVFTTDSVRNPNAFIGLQKKITRFFGTQFRKF